MLVEDLILNLSKYPKGTDVVILDWRKNLYHPNDDTEASGIIPNFFVSYLEEDVEVPYIGLVFINEDYSHDGHWDVENLED